MMLITYILMTWASAHCSFLTMQVVEDLGTRDEQVQPPASFLCLNTNAESGEGYRKCITIMFLCINWEAVAAYSPLATFLITLFAAIGGLCKYYKDIDFSHEATRNRMLAEYNQRYSQNTSIQKVVKALMNNKFKDVEAYDAEIFMRFFEELQLLIKSDNKMKKEIACYMFSYYAIEAFKSDEFKNKLNGVSEGGQDNQQKKSGENDTHQNYQPVNPEIDKDDWALFRAFVSDMEEIRKSLYTNDKINKLTI